jgi:hypothetical protein
MKNKCLIIVLSLLLVIAALIGYTHYKIENSYKKLNEIEFKDSLNKYNKIYYETTINELKKTNKQLYDSLDASKNMIDFLVQFNAKQEYKTGKVIIKHDTTYIDTTKTKDAKTFEYTNVNPNDTMNYKLKINSTEEPNWYSLDISTSTKYTIVNKDYGNNTNHITIDGGNNTTDITDVTVFKKKKKTFWSRFGVGPSVTAGYDVINKNFGVMPGVSVTYDLTK